MANKKKVAAGARVFSALASLLAKLGIWKKGDKFAAGADVAADVLDQEESDRP
jgi:hypothetical protein